MADYEIITEGTIGSTTQNVDITSIPGTFKHLEVTLVMASTNASYTDDMVNIQLNGDTTSGNYCRAFIYNQNSSGSVSSLLRQGFGSTGAQDRMWAAGGYLPTRYGGAAGKLFGYTRILFPGYTNTNWTKSALSMSSVAGNYDFPSSNSSGTGAFHGCWGWNNTAAITSIKLMCNRTGGFLTNSTYMIAGIA